MKAGRGFVRLTVATNHPVSTFLILASWSVFANTLLSWVRGGLGKAFGLRKVRRCLIAGLSLMLDILMTTEWSVEWCASRAHSIYSHATLGYKNPMEASR